MWPVLSAVASKKWNPDVIVQPQIGEAKWYSLYITPLLLSAAAKPSFIQLKKKDLAPPTSPANPLASLWALWSSKPDLEQRQPGTPCVAQVKNKLTDSQALTENFDLHWQAGAWELSSPEPNIYDQSYPLISLQGAVTQNQYGVTKKVLIYGQQIKQCYPKVILISTIFSDSHWKPIAYNEKSGKSPAPVNALICQCSSGFIKSMRIDKFLLLAIVSWQQGPPFLL